MPCHYDIYPDLNLAVFTYEGVLRAREIVTNAERVDSDPAYTPDMNELADFRTLKEVDIDAATLSNLSGLMMGLYLRSARSKRIAMLVPDVSVQVLAHGFADVIAQNTRISIAVFDALDSALGFLDLVETDLPKNCPLLKTG